MDFSPQLLAGAPGWVLHGASLDMNFALGQYFARGGSNALSSLLTTTRASTGYAQTSGGLLVPFSNNVPRITDLGLLVEQAATCIALWNRDLTNANWTKSNVTAALDQVGMDGVSNSASSLTATANNGTATAAAISSASASRTVTMGVKRITGSGAVSISQDGGSTFTAITTKVGASWYIPTPADFSGLTQTATNPQIVIKLGTSGDKIAVDFVDLEAGAINTSPIATTNASAARAADNISLAGTATTAALNAKSAFFWTGSSQFGASQALLLIYSGGSTPDMFYNNTPDVRIFNGSTSLAATPGSGSVLTSMKSAFGFDGAGTSAIANGGTKATNATAMASLSGSVTIGSNGGASALNGYMKRFALSPVKGAFDGLTT